MSDRVKKTAMRLRARMRENRSKQGLGAAMRLRALAKMLRLGTIALDQVATELKPWGVLAPETFEKLERVVGEGATQLEAAASATDVAAEAITRLAELQGNPQDHE